MLLYKFPDQVLLEPFAAGDQCQVKEPHWHPRGEAFAYIAESGGGKSKSPSLRLKKHLTTVGLRDPVVIVSPEIKSPALFGFLRPKFGRRSHENVGAGFHARPHILMQPLRLAFSRRGWPPGGCRSQRAEAGGQGCAHRQDKYYQREKGACQRDHADCAEDQHAEGNRP